MANITLQAFSRGKEPALKVAVKAELYGPGVDNQHLIIDDAVLEQLLNKVNRATMIDLLIDGQTPAPVLIREIQREPVKGKIQHIDFLQIDPKKKVTVQVDLEPVGKSAAITNLGATLVKNMQTLKVECMPDAMVAKIEADLSKLVNVTDVIRVADLVAPTGITIKNHPREAVFSLAASRKGRAGKPEEGAAAAPAGEAAPAAAAAPAKKEKKDKK